MEDLDNLIKELDISNITPEVSQVVFELVNQISNRNARIELLKAELAELTRRYTGKDQLAYTLTTQLEPQLAEIEKLRSRLGQAKHENNRSAFELRKLTKELDTANHKITLAQKEYNILEYKYNTLQEGYVELKQAYEALLGTRSVQTFRSLGLSAHEIRQSVKILRHTARNLLPGRSATLINGVLDLPEPDSIITDTLTILGWATSTAAHIQRVEVFLGGLPLGLAEHGLWREDVIKSRPWEVNGACGYKVTLSVDELTLEKGSHELLVRVVTNKGHEQDYRRQIKLEESVVTSLDPPDPYTVWINECESKLLMPPEQYRAVHELSYRPLISIITPVYNTVPEYLQAMITSVRNQTYPAWELCLVDGGSSTPGLHEILLQAAQEDPRIRVKLLEKNRGISGNSNEALQMAQGEFVGLLDHDDELTPMALYENVLLLNQHAQADMIYSDEDKLNKWGKRCDPFFKPDWSPDLFLSMMYTCHFGLYRRELLNEINGFCSRFDGAQDYDLVLRLIERTDKIYHIPKILYHWRMTPNSTALNINTKSYSREAQLGAVQQYCERNNLNAVVDYGLTGNTLRMHYHLKDYRRVSIIIPTRDEFLTLRQCVDSIQFLTKYPNYEIIIINNNSVKPETLHYFDTVTENPDIKVFDYNKEFNFSAINNYAVTKAEGELLLFLNNDTEVISEEWLEAMVEHAVRPEVGVVGARLLYPDKTLQHGGVILGIGGVAGHAHKYLDMDKPGYTSRAQAIQNFSAVTGACLMTRRDVFETAGGLDEQNLAIAFNDVDYCLKVRELGLLVVWTPYSALYHHESLSRGSENTPAKVIRFNNEVNYMLQRWSTILSRDPYYNPNLTLETEDFSLARCNGLR